MQRSGSDLFEYILGKRSFASLLEREFNCDRRNIACYIWLKLLQHDLVSVRITVSLEMNGTKRDASEITGGKTLEEAVFEYIDKFQERNNGKGVGMTCDHLNKNIEHPDKPKGSGSQARFKKLMREMPSLIESKDKWEGQTVFLVSSSSKLKNVKAQRKDCKSELEEAENLITAVTNEMQNRLNTFHSSTVRVSVVREEYARSLEELLAAKELIRFTREGVSS